MTPSHPNLFHTRVLKESTHNHARVTQITTPHGDIQTPAFMPVGTRAFVNHLTPHDLKTTGSQIILGGNTYHMLVHPGLETILAAGGMHTLMGWDAPMLTDSGGFQVFSLSQDKKICTIDAFGAHFKHPISGKVIHLTPQTSIAAQKVIGADIIMAFDECTPEAGGIAAAQNAMERTHRWLLDSKAAHEQDPFSAYGKRQALFGIIQGGSFYDLRMQSTEKILAADCDGIAIGGEIIGFDMHKTVEVIDWIRPHLPRDKTRYTMGVGASPQDLIDVVARGVDIFDCVAPTRNARHGALFHGEWVEKDGWLQFVADGSTGESKGRLLIKKAIYAHDRNPILEGCGCYTCQHFSRAYLHLLFKQNASLYYQLACIHNIHVMQATCARLRELI